MRLIQLRHVHGGRRTGLVDGHAIALLEDAESIYSLAQRAMGGRSTLARVVEGALTGETLDYDSIYEGTADWRILPAIDHPTDAARCLVSGTGLTHLASAKNRDAMHAKADDLTDSMRMYQLGVEAGRPADGGIGAAPEWFYKGTGIVLRAHGEALDIPAHAEDGGEEPEIAGIYVIDAKGAPRRIGMAQGNEFSDHKFEKRNYLNLAASKLMTCAIGPELVVDADFGSVEGEVAIERDGGTLWHKAIRSGDAAMTHSLGNLEHHHFKHAAHRRPGDVHVHYFGAGAFSFGEGIALRDGDVMSIRFDGFGRALRNPLRVAEAGQTVFAALPL